ncbi:hypothetical protein [Lysobacter gummosus]|uniref:hypothetical protein n=1 Tax=Lysobacter gummosus TaxID=262324 RepID=UPI00363522B1
MYAPYTRALRCDEWLPAPTITPSKQHSFGVHWWQSKRSFTASPSKETHATGA